jgi:RHS repeat-associated protein
MERDTEDNNFFDHARSHDFNLGRFVSVDLFPGRVENPQSWNRYAYALANPLRFIDPSGLIAQCGNAVKGDDSTYQCSDVVYGQDPNSLMARFDEFLTQASFRFVEPFMNIVGSNDPNVLAKSGAQIGLAAVSGVSALKVLRYAQLSLDAAEDLEGLGGNPFEGKSADEIDQMFREKGYETRGSDPVHGKGGYVNPRTGRSFHIDPGVDRNGVRVEEPHVDVNRPRGFDLFDKKKLPYQE